MAELHARHQLENNVCMGNDEVCVTVQLTPSGDGSTASAKLTQAELCQALGVNNGTPEIAGMKSIELVASEAPAGGTTAYSVFDGSGNQIPTSVRASVYTPEHAMSHHFVHQGKTMSHAQVPVTLTDTVSDETKMASLKRFARWNKHAQEGADMKTVMQGIKSVKITSGPQANTVMHAVPVVAESAQSQTTGAMTTLFARNRDNEQFNMQVFNSKRAPDTVMINGEPHLQVTDDAMQTLQANMKDNLTVKPQANGMIIKSTTYNAEHKTSKGPTATFRIKRTPLSHTLDASAQKDTTAPMGSGRPVTIHEAITTIEGPAGAILSDVGSSADRPESTVQAVGSALFGPGAHTVESVSYDN